MKAITGLIGRDALVEKAVQDVRKGRHVLLTGPVGVGKSAVLAAVIDRLERRRGERTPVEADADEPPSAGGADPPPTGEGVGSVRSVLHRKHGRFGRNRPW